MKNNSLLVPVRSSFNEILSGEAWKIAPSPYLRYTSECYVFLTNECKDDFKLDGLFKVINIYDYYHSSPAVKKLYCQEAFVKCIRVVKESMIYLKKCDGLEVVEAIRNET
jgi:hypothetical protein